jgi:NADH dehydrogenase/NADH:ubiquinone oxidoreductase subunit G
MLSIEEEKNKSINMDQVNVSLDSTIRLKDEVNYNNNNNNNITEAATSSQSSNIQQQQQHTNEVQNHRPTSYIETMMHLFKGNVGKMLNNLEFYIY